MCSRGNGTIDNTNANPSAISLGSSTSTALQNFAGVIQNTGGALTVIKNGTSASFESLTGLNTYTGATVINTGTLQVNSLANGGTASVDWRLRPVRPETSSLTVHPADHREYDDQHEYLPGKPDAFGLHRPPLHAGRRTERLIPRELTATASPLLRPRTTPPLVFNGTAATGGVTGTDAIAFGTSGSKTLTLQGNSAGDNAINLVIKNNTIDSSVTNLGQDRRSWPVDSGERGEHLQRHYHDQSGYPARSGCELQCHQRGDHPGGSVGHDGFVGQQFQQRLVVGQTVTGGIAGSPTIAAILDPTHHPVEHACNRGGGHGFDFW